MMPRKPKPRHLYPIGSRVTKFKAFCGDIETVEILGVKATTNGANLYKVLGQAKGVFGAPTRFTLEHEIKRLATAYERTLPAFTEAA